MSTDPEDEPRTADLYGGEVVCEACGGAGSMDDGTECEECGGTGQLQHT